MKNTFLFVALSFLFYQSFAQTFAWSNSIGGSGNEVGRSIVTDASGNVYTTGDFSGTVDFNPGAGTFNLTSSGTFSGFVQKLDANGNFVWAMALDGASTCRGIKLATDPSGNVYVTGFFTGIVDFDPGPGTDFHDAGSTVFRDYFILKLNSSGNFVWAHTFGAANEATGSDVAIDAQNNVIIVGHFSNTVDFDPSAGMDTLSANNEDIFIHKLDSAGNHLWVRSLNSPSDDGPDGVSVDASGNIYVTGMFSLTIDFDPGSGTDMFTSGAMGWNGFLLKLNAAGNYAWAKQFYSNQYSKGLATSVCSNGDILVTGIFRDTLDTNPGTGSSFVTSNGGLDIFAFRFSNTGNVIWNKTMGGPMDDYGREIEEDASGNIFLAGQFSDTVDFDPGAGISLFNSLGNADIFVQQLNGSGGYISLMQMGGTDNESAQAIACANNAIYITGQYAGSVDLNPFLATAAHTAVGSTDFFVIKLNGSPNSLAEVSKGINAFLYPNPTAGKFFIEGISWDIVQDISLYTISGQKITFDTTNLASNKEVDIIHLPAGIYYLTLTTEDYVHNFRVVRE